LGYAMAEHMRTSLVTDALAMAARNITIHRDVTIFHSDYAEVCVKPENSDFACAA